jgi:hypothetical protein
LNTLLTYEQQLVLVDRKLAVKKTDGIFDTFKYHRRVMYDYLWDSEPNVHECRGHVYDNRNGNLVQAAPRKSFNYLENGWWKDVPLDTKVCAYKKFNGYMACATLYEGQLVVSTTGSTTSEYAVWAKELVKTTDFCGCSNYETDLFEIVVPQDPHIVKEEMGAHHLGFRDKIGGSYCALGKFITCSLADILEIAKTNRGEGFMVYTEDGNCCKVKTPYYVGKKKLMRMSPSNVEKMYNNPQSVSDALDPMWSDVVFYVQRYIPKEIWLSYDDQKRRQVIESIQNLDLYDF